MQYAEKHSSVIQYQPQCKPDENECYQDQKTNSEYKFRREFAIFKVEAAGRFTRRRHRISRFIHESPPNVPFSFQLQYLYQYRGE